MKKQTSGFFISSRGSVPKSDISIEARNMDGKPVTIYKSGKRVINKKLTDARKMLNKALGRVI